LQTSAEDLPEIAMPTRIEKKPCTIIDPRVQSLCAEFDVEIIPGNAYPEPGQTRAPASIRRLIDKHEAEHARLVLCILAEGKGNDALIDETGLSAISDLLLACPDVVEGSTSDLLELFDNLPLCPYMAIANELRGVVHHGRATNNQGDRDRRNHRLETTGGLIFARIFLHHSGISRKHPATAWSTR
jgi:hypothetical protein